VTKDMGSKEKMTIWSHITVSTRMDLRPQLEG
jgi:hypothetical protein